MKMNKLFSAFAALMLLFTVTSCDNGPDQVQWSNVVTYQGLSNGQPAVSWQGMNDSESIMLLLNTNLPADILPGSRLFLSFIANVDATITNGTVVEPISLVRVETITPQTVSGTPAEWEGDELYLQFLFRSGHYLNLQSLIPGATKNESMKWEFLIDYTTIGTSNIVAYLSYTNTAAEPGASNSVTYLNCVDINSIMSAGAKTLTVNINNSNTAPNQDYGPDYGQASQSGKVIVIPMPDYWN